MRAGCAALALPLGPASAPPPLRRPAPVLLQAHWVLHIMPAAAPPLQPVGGRRASHGR